MGKLKWLIFISLSFSLFFLAACHRAEQMQEVRQEIQIENRTILEENIVENDIKIEVNATQNINYIIHELDESKFITYMKNPQQFMIDIVRYLLIGYLDEVPLLLSLRRINIDIEHEAWLSSFMANWAVPADVYFLFLHVISPDNIKTYRFPFEVINHNLETQENFGAKVRRFPLSNLNIIPGRFKNNAWLYDINGDGFDEIIILQDRSYDRESQRNPEILFKIIGYCRNVDGFINLKNITTVISDVENGPEPIELVQNQDVLGFRLLVDISKNEFIYPIPMWKMKIWGGSFSLGMRKKENILKVDF